MSTILITGFEAFGHTPVNPAELAAKRLDGAKIDGAKLVARIVSNSFFECIEVARAAIEEIRPETVVMMGEYGGRALLTVERIAQNLNDNARYQLPDNQGRSMRGALTASDGPTAYYSTLPIRVMVKAMRAAGIPSDISDVAGTFCCNHLMYGILHHIAVNSLPIRAGWIHLPFLPEVAALEENLGAPSMSVETVVAGVRAAISAILSHPADIDDTIVSRLQI